MNKYKIKNVQLHPDATFKDITDFLQKSKYFLHTLINEPFGITAVQAIAAGCIPIVHDSGGQKETVPEECLRYQDLNEVLSIINQLEAMNSNAEKKLLQSLQNYISKKFDATIFHKLMANELAKLLNINTTTHNYNH